jgi:2-amino-4-hydroxy-6-hydroxymethyldihydropteridine diphosphokinase
MPERIYVALGSNIERATHLPAGLRAIKERFGRLAVSTLYECPAVGFDGAAFYNAVVAFDGDEAVQTVHSALHAIEARFGRDRHQPKFCSRTLDLDLLLWGDHVVEEGRLVLPRPEIDRVAFVLAPLAELAGERLHPIHREPFTALWARFDGVGKHELSPVEPDGLVPPEIGE